MKQQLMELIEKRMQQCVAKERTSIEDEKFARKRDCFHRRNAEIVHVKAKGKVEDIQKKTDETKELVYTVHLQYFIKQGELFFVEEEVENRKGIFYKGVLIEDKEIAPVYPDYRENPLSEEFGNNTEGWSRYSYDRLKAVQYAEKWWNSYNPKYHQFEVDCTNYISQCVHEGGAPMRGYPNRNKGWWMQNNNWSYSWSVANAFPRYLETSTTGLRAKQVNNAIELKLGDVICYDFEGDGKYNHTTIVTGKDANGEPLVNAHTYNSRMRYWKYEDSTAYTPIIKYKFFTIIDG
ncbi:MULTISPECIES: amidase domain-containing protein [Bacillaceae]|uniref:amidase domain-containing protein n=1 Tax=Bacillaceae TaxID=186817 RepID=UPI00065FFF76|nr:MULTISPECIES: amidase domain-containing protein [Bacillaceae]MCF2650031.1 amidase domain-containing protein [Niallia circulans]